MAALRTAMVGDDQADIEAKTQKLTEYSGKMAERLYATPGAEGADTAPPKDSDKSGGAGGSSEQVVDAEFEEIKEGK